MGLALATTLAFAETGIDVARGEAIARKNRSRDQRGAFLGHQCKDLRH
ncbi:hypothetical protein [Phormidium sp. CCY1219]|nr:hypothetical protein [Phormidium sp. CCY1219]MEB3829220.1 hypothetical protein [Phormidium sp. CCY1219]